MKIDLHLKHLTFIASVLGLVVLLVIVTSCNKGINLDEANKVLTSFNIEWDKGLKEGECGSKYPVHVKIIALDQDGEELKWNGPVDIVLTNPNITFAPTQVEIKNGEADVDLVFQHPSEDIEETNIKLSSRKVSATINFIIKVYPHIHELKFASDYFTVVKSEPVPLELKIVPENAWNKTLEWNCEDSEIATIDKNGVLTGLKDGITKVTARSDAYGIETECNVEVGIIRWNKMIGGSGFEGPYSIQKTDDGNFIISGESTSTDIEGVIGYGSTDFYVAKFDQKGNIIWQNMFGGWDDDNCRSMAVTNDSGCILAGWTWNRFIEDFENQGQCDYYIVKVDANGNKMWAVMTGGNSYDTSSGIKQLSDGGYIIVGSSASTNIQGLTNNGGYDCYLVKLDENGGVEWQKMFGGSGDDSIKSIIQTSDGGYLGVGNSSSTNIPEVLNHGNHDYYLVKFDSNWDIVWQKMIGGSGDDYLSEMTETSDGYYILAGHSNSTDIEGLTNYGDFDFYVVKIDIEGDIIWEKMFGGSDLDQAWSISPTNDGGCLVTGSSMSTDIPGLLRNNKGNRDYYIVRLDSNGDILWQTMLGGDNDDLGLCGLQTDDNGYIVCGETDTIYLSGATNHGAFDWYIVRLW